MRHPTLQILIRDKAGALPPRLRSVLAASSPGTLLAVLPRRQRTKDRYIDEADVFWSDSDGARRDRPRLSRRMRFRRRGQRRDDNLWERRAAERLSHREGSSKLAMGVAPIAAIRRRGLCSQRSGWARRMRRAVSTRPRRFGKLWVAGADELLHVDGLGGRLHSPRRHERRSLCPRDGLGRPGLPRPDVRRRSAAGGDRHDGQHELSQRRPHLPPR